jgi:hypothetical protein
MIEVQKSKLGKFNQNSCSKVFKQENCLIPKKVTRKNRFSLRKEALRGVSKTNPLLARDREVTKFRMFLHYPR